MGVFLLCNSVEKGRDCTQKKGRRCFLSALCGVFTWTCTGTMRYGLAMATALTTTGMSGDFPSVYINHHGNNFSLCVRTFMDSGQSIVVRGSQRLSVCSWSCNLLNQRVCVCVQSILCRQGCEGMQGGNNECSTWFYDYIDKQSATQQRRKKKKNLINDDNLLDNITARRDSEELFCVIQQNRITNKSQFLSGFCCKCQDV